MNPLSDSSSSKVSVLIPAYNAMDFLPETVASVLAQTYTDFELIIVNDGSADEVERWAAGLSDARIRLVSQRNQGLAGARNTGLRQARGEYVAFIDADDLWLPTKLAQQVALLEADPEMGVVYTWVALIDETGEPIGKVRKNYARGDVWVPLTTHNIVECGSVALVRRTCFDRVGWFDETLPQSCSEDWDMWLRIAAGDRFELIEAHLVQYRCHANNLSSRWQVMDESFRMVLKKAFDAAPEPMQVYKNRSFGSARLKVAWKALQNSNGNCKTALQFEKEAVDYDPKIRQTSEDVRFKTALLFVRLFGLQPYNRCRQVGYRLKDTMARAVVRG